MDFASLGLAAPLLQALQSLGHDAPTAVQARVVPTMIAGADVLVSSPTGSGKTGAYLLPALQRMLAARTAAEGADAPAAGAERRPRTGRARPRALVIAPTRELAMQIEKAALGYGRHVRPFHTVSLIGGAPFGPQLRRLADGVDLIVATPGRLVDHLERGRLDLGGIELLVLDEADRMLDMGFVDDILGICTKLPADRQTVLFSATLDGRVAEVARRVTRSPQRIEVGVALDRSQLTQVVHFADHLSHKHRLLDALLQSEGMHQAVIFASTKASAEELSIRLRDAGYPAAALHGDMPQHARNRVVQQLRSGDIGVLVATDVASRGIDIPSISHVINFDLPMKAEDYVHRIGRTARAGRNGTSVTLVTARDRRNLADIERLMDERIPVAVIPGLEPRERQIFPSGGYKPGGHKPGGHKPGGYKAGAGRPSTGGRGRTTGGWTGGDRTVGSGRGDGAGHRVSRFADAGAGRAADRRSR
jgi:superfamily II DNA/RNA helicase